MTTLRIVFVNFPVKTDLAQWPKELLPLQDSPFTRTVVFSILPEGRKENADLFKANCAIQHQVFTWENLNISLAAQVADFFTRQPVLLRDKQSAAVLVQEMELIPDLSQTTIESLTTSSCGHVLAALSAGAHSIATQGGNTNWTKIPKAKVEQPHETSSRRP